MLDMGFREDIDAITQELVPAPERQTFVFSATISKPIQQVAREVLSRNHVYLNCVAEEDSPVHEHVPQYHTVLPSASEQLNHILRLISQPWPGASQRPVGIRWRRTAVRSASNLAELGSFPRYVFLAAVTRSCAKHRQRTCRCSLLAIGGAPAAWQAHLNTVRPPPELDIRLPWWA